MEETKVELLLGTKNQEPLAKLSHLQNYKLNLFLKPSLHCKRKDVQGDFKITKSCSWFVNGFI